MTDHLTPTFVPTSGVSRWICDVTRYMESSTTYVVVHDDGKVIAYYEQARVGKMSTAIVRERVAVVPTSEVQSVNPNHIRRWLTTEHDTVDGEIDRLPPARL